jgi:cation diffusion facilitator family transporter
MASDSQPASPPSPTRPSVEAAGREKRWVALTSVGAAVVLTGTKLVVGFMTGSLGLLAEAAHSGLDLVAAVITYIAVRFSDKPADAEHPYGHGKIENLSALVETLLLLVTCVWIIFEAVRRLFFKDHDVHATVWAFLVIGVSIVIDISRSRALSRVAKKHNSQALEADALHFSTDVWSSAVVLLGLALVRLGPAIGQTHLLIKADAVAALLVALIVVFVSYRLGRRTIDMLLDRAPPGVANAIEQAVKQIAGVMECRQLRLRQSGNQSFVDLVIGVRRGLSVERSHAISSAAEEQIKGLLPNADVVVHVDPVCGTDETLPERIRAIAVNEGQTVHNIQVSKDGDRLYIELHVEVDEHLPLGQAHENVDRLEAAIIAEMPDVAAVTTHIEPTRAHHEPQQDVSEISRALVRRVRRIVAEMPGVDACHEVTVRRSGEDIFLTMHCTFAPRLSVGEVHEISTRLERRLRAAIPHLERVTTHAEPIATNPGDTTGRGD